MRLSTAIDCVRTFPQPEDYCRLANDVAPEWIDEALAATGVATLRRRRIPAEQVPWLVIGMALFRDRPITDVVDKLDLALPSRTGAAVARSAVVQARDRVGESPLAWLFARSADHWTHSCRAEDRWRGLKLYGIDGTTLQTPDSQENREHFGAFHVHEERSNGYPHVRLVALMELRTHLIAAASFGTCRKGEQGYAQDLWPALPDNSLVIADRLYFGADALISVTSEGKNRHWLLRAKSNLRGRRLKRLSPNDELMECTVSPQARELNSALPETWIVRVITYQRKGFRPQRLITSLLDSEGYPAAELAELYHERWELELAYDEVKTEMLDSVPLRSKSVDRVRQEIWGLLIAYNLVRLEMQRVADEANVLPTRISFMAVYRMICDEFLWCAIASPGAIPKHLQRLRQQVKLFVLPPRRSDRRYPREVKKKMSRYAKKRRLARTTRKRS